MQKCTLNVRSFFKLRNKYKHCQFDRKMDLFKVKRKKKRGGRGNATLILRFIWCHCTQGYFLTMSNI